MPLCESSLLPVELVCEELDLAIHVEYRQSFTSAGFYYNPTGECVAELEKKGSLVVVYNLRFPNLMHLPLLCRGNVKHGNEYAAIEGIANEVHGVTGRHALEELPTFLLRAGCLGMQSPRPGRRIATQR